MTHPKDILTKEEIYIIKLCSKVMGSDKIIVEDFSGEKIRYILPEEWRTTENNKRI